MLPPLFMVASEIFMTMVVGKDFKQPQPLLIRESHRRNQMNGKPQQQCPYLSTVKKHLLDFDFEKICCISLSHTNIYACLVCGRYFQGRSSTSHAYQHSIEFSHYVFMNLQNSKIYCLPDDYEVDSYTMADVKFNLNPTYTHETIEQLAKVEDVEYNVDGKQFIPGVVGINNLGHSDYATSVVYVLNSVPQIRKYFLLNVEFEDPMLQQFGLLIRKIWNPKNFKGIVSPHEFLQTLTDASLKKFKIGKPADPLELLLWLLDNLSKAIRKKEKKKNNFDLQGLFRGKLKTSIIRGIKDSYEYEDAPSKVNEIPFSLLKLEFPEQGVFNKSQNQVKLDSLMQKYVGKVGEKHPQGLRFMKITEFPEYLTLYFKRFKHNGYMMEKDSSHLLYDSELNLTSDSKAHYNLIAQICHVGEAETGKYRVLFKMQHKWFQVEDLEAKQVLEKQAMLGQPCLQVYSIGKTPNKNPVLLQ